MASKIKVDQIEGSTGSSITIPSGQTLTIADGLASSSLPTVPVSKGGTGITSLGTAGQALKVNSGASALEFGDISSEAGKYPFHAKTSGTTSDLTHNANTEIIFNSEWYDPDSKYDTSTGRYTPGETGYYYVSAGITVNDYTGGGDYLYPKFLVNGSSSNQYGQGQDGGASSQARIFTTSSAVIQLTNASDYISFFVYQTAGGSRQGQGSTSFFQGFKIA